MLVVLASLVGVWLFLDGVVAATGVFAVFALRAGGHVEVKLRANRLGIGRGFDLDDDGKILAFGDGFVGDEFVAVLGEGEFGRRGAVAHGDGDGLLGGSYYFAYRIQETDFYFLIRSDEKLGVWRDG